MRNLIISATLLVFSSIGHADTGYNRVLSDDAAEVADILLNFSTPGYEELQVCLAKFRVLQESVQFVRKTYGSDEEPESIYEIVASSKKGNGDVVLTITTGEGSIDCSVEENQ